MSILRRFPREGNVYFIASVTFRRRPILTEYSKILTNSFATVNQKTPFDIIAWVILPDHFHALIDPKGNDISSIVQRIKMSFGAKYRMAKDLESGRIWQNRFWDHIIRDQADMNAHIDYIHYNPVKHGLVTRPFDWRMSSIHEFRDLYSNDWGCNDEIKFAGDFGE